MSSPSHSFTRNLSFSFSFLYLDLSHELQYEYLRVSCLLENLPVESNLLAPKSLDGHSSHWTAVRCEMPLYYCSFWARRLEFVDEHSTEILETDHELFACSSWVAIQRQYTSLQNKSQTLLTRYRHWLGIETHLILGLQVGMLKL